MADPRLVAIGAQLAAGEVNSARLLADRVLADGGVSGTDRIAALVLSARVHEAMRNFARAIADLEQGLALDPAHARLWNELGLLCADAGHNDRAIAAFDRATRAEPGFSRAWNNLGNALRAEGRLNDAIGAAQHAVDIDPDYALAWANLGALKRDAGDDAGAEIALRRALVIDADQRSALLTLGGLLRDRSDLAGAAHAFARLCERDPANANAALQLAGTLAEGDDLAAARAAFRRTQAIDPRVLRALLGEHLTLPMVAASCAELDAARQRYADGLAALERELPARAASLSGGRLLDELRWSNFLLAYQGGDDASLQARYGSMVGAVVAAGLPQWTQPLAKRTREASRIRVGFLSTFFRDGTVGRYFERWITDLPGDEFEVFLYHLLPGADPLARRLENRADHFRHCPWWRPSQLAPRVRADALDVLVYPELGMGAVPFALAALRLAPLQCTAWGHPVTTGHPAIDVFFSSVAMEPHDGGGHYTERLVSLPGIGTRYGAPAVPADASRDRFGLPRDRVLLLCPQSLFKIHPENDALFAEVLRRLSDAVIVMFEGRDPKVTARFRARLTVAGIAASRIQFLPQCGHDDFLRINTVCDVMLDTLHWSGGNTSLDALACGLPLVTLPGRFMRGRQSAGMLRLMGIEELIASDHDDYVERVVQLAGDDALRHATSSRLRDARHRVFDDVAPVVALAAFLRENA